ncbi:helix-turn-helix domain-containing protein [Loigolactobacillus coryniformis]|uniref:helix-turn-helix domain-containing protein n=1 Tax=Loigolactobacillus coryniformis TaxID=1610 RepID=UPI001C5DB611|nr:helix-turn-helix domain-containing protein [Loigolactobacillus coryniformis]MBW4803763.1 helix-turn-helix domain-containing protein [Loigolactobacillus coryniformis subsp. torquens]MBW4806465.1 helix-turn-helix domain-containing protein [Loigolactobacillus coryniformis subsp. torquens]
MWNKIQKILNERDMSVNELANKAGFKNNSIMYAFKHGRIKKPSFLLMEKIADALGVSMDEFRSKN